MTISASTEQRAWYYRSGSCACTELCRPRREHPHASLNEPKLSDFRRKLIMVLEQLHQSTTIYASQRRCHHHCHSFPAQRQTRLLAHPLLGFERRLTAVSLVRFMENSVARYVVNQCDVLDHIVLKRQVSLIIEKWPVDRSRRPKAVR